jgi:branched-chain amino acid transport system ATP-binding protein
VIGVNTAIFSPSGGSIGIGFAIPAETVQRVVADLKSDGEVTRGWIGVQIQPITADIADSIGLSKAEGALVRADDLVAGYVPGVNILNNSDLYAHEGELIGIIGPNGAGKSTLLKAIFGMVKVREGTVTVNGESVVGLKSDKLVQRGVGFVPQTNNVFPSLTIEENLQMGLYQAPKTYNERLEFVTGIFAELGKRLKQRAGSLSGGERQMVAMSRALMMDPAVLLLDEPSAGLSPVRQDDAFIRVSDINKAGVTTIMVEQNARRCLQICDRGYVLDQGRDAYEGSGRALLNDPKVIGLYLGTLGSDGV